MQDVATLGVINARYYGYVAVVKVDYGKKSNRPLSQNVDINDQPEGGANALNINRFVIKAFGYLETTQITS